MKAVLFHEHGGVEKLRYEEVPDPVPAGDEVLVRVRACALNHLDLWTRNGIPSRPVPLPHIVGSDVSGEISQTGSLATHLRPGQRVLVSPGLSCGRCQACLSGQDNLCPGYDVLGARSNGGYAELVKVPAANIVPIPESISHEQAAAFPLVYLTAWHMLVSRAKIRPGETVLVLAAGSGVGSAAVEIAKLWGARVIATAGSDEKLRRARELGADETIHHYRQDIAGEVRRMTEKRGADVVIEHVGKATWEQSLRSLSYNGRLVTCGATTGPEASVDLRVLFAKHLSLLGSYMGTKGELLEAFQLFRQGRLKPAVDRVFPLREAAEAQRRMEESKHFGKIVLQP